MSVWSIWCNHVMCFDVKMKKRFSGGCLSPSISLAVWKFCSAGRALVIYSYCLSPCSRTQNYVIKAYCRSEGVFMVFTCCSVLLRD